MYDRPLIWELQIISRNRLMRRLYTSVFIIPLLCMRNREDFWFLSQIRFTRKKRIIV